MPQLKIYHLQVLNNMIEISDKEVYTTSPETMKVHRLNTDVYFSRCTRLNNDTLDDFEEVRIEDIPQSDKLENEEL